MLLAPGFPPEGTWIWNQYPKGTKRGIFFNFMRNLLVFKDSVSKTISGGNPITFEQMLMAGHHFKVRTSIIQLYNAMLGSFICFH
jgi:hypothetical protein